MRPRRQQIRRTQAVLGWALLFFVMALVGFTVIVEWRYPQLYDPEYAVRLRLLRQRLAEAPDRPLLLLVGSSRTVMNFRPELLPTLRDPNGRPVVVFNFSHLGAGPVMNLVEVRRLLRAGIRPRWLVAEVMPPQLGDERQNVILDTASAGDLVLVSRYAPLWKLCGLFARNRLNPWYKHRVFLMQCLAPRWVPPGLRIGEDSITLNPLGGDHNWCVHDRVDPLCVYNCLEAARQGYYPALQHFRIADISDRAVGELITLCRQEGIRLVLLLTPEGKTFRSWYSPATRGLIDDYCRALSRRPELLLIDARDWLAEELFIDSHHTLPSGADAFTLRLGQEVLQPFVQDRLR